MGSEVQGSADVASSRAEEDLEALLDLAESLNSSKDIRKTLTRATELLARILGCQRCSVIVLENDGRHGYVLAASDDAEPGDHLLDLESYPEIREVVRTRKPLAVADVDREPLFESVRDRVRAKGLKSVVLFPVRIDREVKGVVALRRTAVSAEPFDHADLRFGRIVASSMGVILRSMRLLESVRDRSERALNRQIKAERRLRQIEKYQRIFDFAGDGLIIIDGSGRILFSNRAAESILGFDASAISRMTLFDVIDPSAQKALEEVMASLRAQSYPRDVDLNIVRANGELATLSLTTAALEEPGRTDDLSEVSADKDQGESRPEEPKDQAVIVSFRDVTEHRRMQDELRRTKDFLANIIESSPDAIVASDMKGKILIFNQAAERILGYARSDALGASVKMLYPEGGAKKVMAALRSADMDSRGRLQDRRFDLLAKNGERVPISLAASIVYDQGAEVATVGIFSDLRERLRMEEALQRAQKRLELSERQSAVVELAGAAAHELNQPLTSILGSAELMQRKIPAESPGAASLRTIIAEAERMAGIVSKLGSITRYETKPYVGKTQILDLDAASGDKEKE